MDINFRGAFDRIANFGPRRFPRNVTLMESKWFLLVGFYSNEEKQRIVDTFMATNPLSCMVFSAPGFSYLFIVNYDEFHTVHDLSDGEELLKRMKPLEGVTRAMALYCQMEFFPDQVEEI